MNDIETTVTEIYHPRPNGLAEGSWQAFKSLQLALDFVEKQRLGVKHISFVGQGDTSTTKRLLKSPP
jgi:hypothetical protein